MKIKFYWCGLDIYSKPFKASGGFTSRYVRWFSFNKYNKWHKKRIGKFVVEFDGLEFPCFNLIWIAFHWGEMADRKFAHEQMEKEGWVNPHK